MDAEISQIKNQSPSNILYRPAHGDCPRSELIHAAHTFFVLHPHGDSLKYKSTSTHVSILSLFSRSSQQTSTTSVSPETKNHSSTSPFDISPMCSPRESPVLPTISTIQTNDNHKATTAIPLGSSARANIHPSILIMQAPTAAPQSIPKPSNSASSQANEFSKPSEAAPIPVTELCTIL
mmetsp:Transcript_3970/g.9004  ORF Transcript_3970/g.9004 Transcript_3970/m.9004 type:complete len:179 (+) Transcript_3970:653-1189(+)